MGKITAARIRATMDWKRSLDQPTLTIKEMEFYENGEVTGGATNVEFNRKHPIRGHSDPVKEAIHNFKPKN